jgi:hypothetical protein
MDRPETNRAHLVLFDIQTRTFGPCLDRLEANRQATHVNPSCQSKSVYHCASAQGSRWSRSPRLSCQATPHFTLELSILTEPRSACKLAAHD